ncbi:hypothetical protein [Methanococcus maripaludis]|nr:hypothetical protein [Methanococcus maripaludis]
MNKIILFLISLLVFTTIAHVYWKFDLIQIFSKFMLNIITILSLAFGLSALVTATYAIKQVEEMKTQRLESYNPKLTLVNTSIPIKDLGECYFCGTDEDFKNSYHNKLKEKDLEKFTLKDMFNTYDFGNIYINLYNIGEGFARNIKFEWKKDYDKLSKELNENFNLLDLTKYENNIFTLKLNKNFENTFKLKKNSNISYFDVLTPVKYSQKAEKCFIDPNVCDVLEHIFDLHLEPEKNIIQIKRYLKIEYQDKNEKVNDSPEFFEIIISIIYDRYLNNPSIFPSEIKISPKIISKKEFLEK